MVPGLVKIISMGGFMTDERKLGKNLRLGGGALLRKKNGASQSPSETLW